MDVNVGRGQLRLAPNVGFTRLPFGGGVLLDSRTLAIVECGERDAELVARVLAAHDSAGIADTTFGPDRSAETDNPDDADVDRLAARLFEAGWLIAGPDQR